MRPTRSPSISVSRYEDVKFPLVCGAGDSVSCFEEDVAREWFKSEMKELLPLFFVPTTSTLFDKSVEGTSDGE